MRKKNEELITNILQFIDDEYCRLGKSPTMREIASKFNVTSACICKYIAEMEKRGLVSNNGTGRGISTKKMQKLALCTEQLPVVGSIACGTPMLAEENIESYITVSLNFLGNGKYFILRAKGNSMINAGIENGNYVIVKQQEVAQEGQIVVALIDNEATLKRYYIDTKRKQVRLHPENDNMEDMYFDSITIQGVAIKVIKDLN
jgi:repressor LexA